MVSFKIVTVRMILFPLRLLNAGYAPQCVHPSGLHAPRAFLRWDLFLKYIFCRRGTVGNLNSPNIYISDSHPAQYLRHKSASNISYETATEKYQIIERLDYICLLNWRMITRRQTLKVSIKFLHYTFHKHLIFKFVCIHCFCSANWCVLDKLKVLHSINVELTSTFLLYRGLVHHHHWILNKIFKFPWNSTFF